MDRRLFDQIEKDHHEKTLLANIAVRLPELEKMLADVNDKWVYEDTVYRYYYQSFKTFRIQQYTAAIAEMLRSLVPDVPLNRWFEDLVKEGTGGEFDYEDNYHWVETTRPMLEAFFHARYFLEMICKYGKQLTTPPTIMSGGWAAVLCLYNIR